VLKPNPFFIYFQDWIIAAKERSTLDESEERSAYNLITSDQHLNTSNNTSTSITPVVEG